MELTVTAFLGALMTKHGAGVPKPAGLIKKQTVFFGGTHAAGRTFGAQGQAVTVAILKGVHLFLNDIRHFANRALEQVRLLNHRHANFLITVLGKHFPDRVFHKLPHRRLLWQDIVHPADCLDLSQVTTLSVSVI